MKEQSLRSLKFPSWGWFGVLLGVFFISRFMLILWGISRVSHYEELEQGYIAVEFLSGLRTNLLDYQVDAYTGGTLMMGLLAVPFFEIFGPTLFSLKLVALLMSALSFTALFFTIQHFFGKKAARFAGFLWIFSPPLLVTTSLMALGSHERVLPGILMLFFTLKYAAAETKSTRWLVGLGIFWGLGFSISYINLISIAASSAVIFSKKREESFLKKGAVLIFSFLIGASYWIYFNSQHDWTGVEFIVKGTVADLQLDAFSQARLFFMDLYKFSVYFLPNALSFRAWGAIPGKLINYLYFVFLFGIIAWDLFWKRLKVPHAGASNFDGKALTRQETSESAFRVFYIAYGIFFPLFHCLSRYKVYTVEANPFDYRYYIPFYSFTFLYLSTVLSKRGVKKTVLVLLVLMGVMSQGVAVWGKPYGTVFQKPGFKSGLRYYMWLQPPFLNFTSFSDFNDQALALLKDEKRPGRDLLLLKAANQEQYWSLGTPAEISASILKLPEHYLRRYFFRRWGAQLEVSYNDTDIEVMNRVGVYVPEPYRRDFYLGAARQLNFAEWTDMKNVVRFIEDDRVPFKEIFYLYWGDSLFKLVRNGYEKEEKFFKKMQFVASLDEGRKRWVYRGMGMPIYRSFDYEQILAMNMDFLKKVIPEAFLKEPYWGVGWHLARRRFRSPQRAIREIKQFKDFRCPYVYQGFREYYRSVDPSEAPRIPSIEDVCEGAL